MNAPNQPIAAPLADRKPGLARLPWMRYGLLVVCVVAQASTILLTWPLWQVREYPVHLPVIDVPQIPLGLWMLATLALILLRPRWGLMVHIGSLLVAFALDQYRTQPQFIALAMLMLAVIEDWGIVVVRWFLASLWMWAGLHKLLSPDWFSFASWNLVGGLGVDPAHWAEPFAWSVGLGELGLGVLAIARPRFAVVPCMLMHVGIVVFLSPLFYNWNVSVVPWNLATAMVGAWVLWNTSAVRPQAAWQWATACLLLLYPAGFYVGWVDHGIASVLYSSHIPRGLITTPASTQRVSGWGDLRVPFPNERRLLASYFERSAVPGSKLHIADPRAWLADAYFVKRPNGQIEAIDRETFLTSAPGEVAGVFHEDRRCVFLLGKAGTVLSLHGASEAIFAAEIPPQAYHANLLQHMGGLQNLQQLILAGCPVTDADLAQLPALPLLRELNLEDTAVTDAGLRHLAQFPRLEVVRVRGSQVSPDALDTFPQWRGRGNDSSRDAS